MPVEPLVVHEDLELYLTARFRALLLARDEPVCANVTVRNVEPAGPLPPKLLVIRFDGSTRTSIVTDEASVALTVRAGTKENPKDANDLSRIVRALFHGLAGTEPDNPVAAVLSSNGPIPVPDAGPHAVRYIAGVLSVVGSALP